MNSFFSRGRVQLFFLALIVFFSRLPFLSAGYGVEEDSWLLALTAKNIALSGHYEMSRAPAHPLQEIIYSLIWNTGPFVYNFFSAVMSVVATIFFSLSLKNLGFKHFLFAGYAFAFTPVVFISSAYTIDYMWAIAFVMMSFYFLLKENFLLAGVFLGLAVGCRTTAILMLIPFCLLLFSLSKRTKKIFILILSSLIAGVLIYLPVFYTYKFSFITSYFNMADRFPYPSIAKIIYKTTVGVFGTVGIFSILFFLYQKLFNKKLESENFSLFLLKKTNWIWIIVIILYVVLYFRVPEKSAYLIPIIPFVILLFGYFLSSRSFKFFCVLLIFSSFFFSINLTDKLRGSEHSPLAMKFSIANQEIFLDPLTGPIFSDYTKRLNKIAFTKNVLEKTKTEQRKIILICGWWYNELQVELWNGKKNQNVKFVFYIDKLVMEKYLSDGYEIFYLPEQDNYNDQYSQINFTDSVAKPYFPF